ncbi:MAG: efflux transporter outer membrane subunit [Bradyrhizobium sp.]|nr:efflux transporter outer membrane subunit [Bradyrhizobium sp.]MBV9566463.1 efflux transporter outer membrane subunit [Bradyrhizobium sp.]
MFERRTRAVAVPLGLAVALSGCAVGPDFKIPSPPDVEGYTSTPLPPRTSAAGVAGGKAQRFVKELDIPADWWSLFHSRKLDALVDRALQANPTLEAALAALRQAQENADAQRGKFVPTIQGNFTGTRQTTPSNVLGSSIPLADGSTTNSFNVVTSQVIISYTFDVWGQNRRAVESLDALADSQRFQAEAARLTLAATVALAAIQEATLRDQITATRELISINGKMLDILQRQLTAGYANRVDVAAQEAQLAQTVATLPPLEKQLGQQRNLLAALSGRFPSEGVPETFTLATFRLPADLPLSLPSRLIDQRPDVRAAEGLLHSANAQVGVAIANMLPNFSINGSGGYTATALGNIADYVSPTNRFLTLAGSATHTIFDGFTLLHQKRAAEAALDQAAAQYRATVLIAFQNVSDTLRALRSDANALKAAAEFEGAAKVSFDLVRQQFDSGYANVLLLLNAQQTYLQARIATIQARANRLADTVALYQALGGGWWNREASADGLPLPPIRLDR